jgi:hypothetical protein
MMCIEWFELDGITEGIYGRDGMDVLMTTI